MMDLNHTTLRTTSMKKEHFDMIQPVPVHLNVEYRGSDERNAVTVSMKVKEMAISLSPQALQMSYIYIYIYIYVYTCIYIYIYIHIYT